MNSIKRSIIECSIYIIYNFSGIELNNEVSRITSILLCGVPIGVNCDIYYDGHDNAPNIICA